MGAVAVSFAKAELRTFSNAACYFEEDITLLVVLISGVIMLS